MKKLTVVQDVNSIECLYVDGLAWDAKGETTVYFIDLVDVAGNEPVTLELVKLEYARTNNWPDTLEEALQARADP
jgi:hypothetical protein